MKKNKQYNIDVENEVLRRHQEVLISLARRASELVDLEQFLQEVSMRVGEALEIDHTKIMRHRPDRGDLFTLAGGRLAAGCRWHRRFPTDMASPAGRAYQTGQPVSVEDIGDDPGFRNHPILVAHGIVSLLNVPILVDGAAWGVLEGDSSVLRGFSDDTIRFMTACADLCGMVVRRARAEAAHAQAMADTAREAQKHGLLLNEMQHRVKNNFQTITAMISLQMKNFPTEEGRAIARRLADNVLAMSLAHDQLSPTRSGEAVELSTYLQALVSSIEKPFERLTIEVDAETMQVGIDQAVPLGLIVNEAVTNAVKHAFSPERGGRIEIQLQPIGAGEAKLTIGDNGKGIGEARLGGSGLKLIEALARQARGKIERDNSLEGTTVRVFFQRPAGSLSS